MQYQLFLFEQTFEEKVLGRLDRIEKRLDKLEDSSTRTRKAQFASIGEFKKIAVDCRCELEDFKNMICRDSCS